MSCNIRVSSVVLVWLLINLIYSFKLNSCYANKSSTVLCLETERNILLQFKQHLHVPSSRLVSWTPSQPDCCKWDEVVCHNFTGHIKELHLHNPYLDYINFQRFKLKGKINPCLMELKYLEYLDLSYNDFGGISIPSFFGSMFSLTYLNLSENGFQGLIPHNLGNLSKLHYLSIGGNNNLYVENLDWLKNLSSLVYLDLNWVDMSAISHDWLGIMNSLPLLQDLHLSLCQLAFIPSWHTVNFTSLSILDLFGNHFDNVPIPKWILSLSKLNSLDLGFNGFTSPISDIMSNLSSLSILRLAHNSLNSYDWLFGLTTSNSVCNLQEIDISFNKFRGEISKALESISLCNSRNLQLIYLSNNEFSGSLPDIFHRLPALTILDLYSNKIVGNIPQSLGTLSNLETLRIGYNMLEGVISEVFFRNLTKLTGLAAPNNNLTLKVDSNWVPPFHLETLHLTHWSIGPKFPRWLQTQHNLYELDLSCTGISNIPSWFWNVSSRLSYLNLSHNQISGELPSRLGPEPQYLINIESALFLSSNNFTGQLPQIPGNIIELDLSNNSLSGSMSFLLCNPMNQVSALTMLNLAKNNLSGDIPDCWKYWPHLQVLILENNHLTGNLPNSISHLTWLKSLHLRNNNLFGEIPASLRNCSRLDALDLGFNYFVGKMPTWLGSFRNLIVLALPSNNLEGEIPIKLCHLVSLQILNLARNNLSGTIPKCFNNLTSMTIVQNLTNLFFHRGYINSFVENALMVIKGREDQYDTILSLLTSIDLSLNKLSGDIPSEMTALLGLRFLNLSGNKLSGEIPNNIGVMQTLESLDMSRNQISGRIPSSMSSMHFLSYLNLACNNLSGEIPQSTQLQSFNSPSFVGNRLCGPPLAVNCSVHDKVNKESQNKRDGTKVEEFYVAVVLGFLMGFWGICGPLLYSRSWRISYYRLLNRVWNTLCAKWQLMWRSLRLTINNK